MRELLSQTGLRLACGLCALLLVIGCSQDEHREVRVTEEEYHGEVREEPPGGMTVEENRSRRESRRHHGNKEVIIRESESEMIVE